MTEKFVVTGMSCAACSRRVENAVGSLGGVEECTVNLLTGEMTVRGNATREEVVGAVTKAGYGIAEEKNSDTLPDKGGKNAEADIIRLRLIISGAIVLILMYLSMGHMVGLKLPEFIRHNHIGVGLLQLLLSLAVMVINQKFFINGVRGIINKAPNMDTLVAIGSGASFLYSAGVLMVMSYAVLTGDSTDELARGLYFDSAAMILTLITLGKLLESRAKGRTTDAIRSLVSLAPRTATLIRGEERVTVSVDEIKVGDLFEVKPGESVPVDGVVEDGGGAVNEAMLTGESLPVDKSIGSTVYAATVNEDGYMVCRATAVGEGTALSSIIRMVKEASQSKAPIAKLADRVAGVFVPVVMSIALLTLVGWLLFGKDLGFSLARAISVLVISCPCALGLATPVAVMVGSGRGARLGALYKNAAALEMAGRIDTVVLDKTGTITMGVPELVDVFPTERANTFELLRIAYSLESRSEHPLGRAITEYCEKNGVKLNTPHNFRVIKGVGVEAQIDGVLCLATSFNYAKTITNVYNLENEYTRLASRGKTPVVFIKGGEALGLVALMDKVRPDAKEAVGLIKSLGISVTMLTGDNEKTASRVAELVGIDSVYAGVLPDGKDEVIRALMQKGRVCMVGDGINDAPSLTRADLGVAVGRGSDVAIDSCDVVLVRDELTVLYDALRLGRMTLRTIKQNLFFAFFYNIVAIPLAIGLFGFSLSPMIGAAAMSLSSICVVSNALRLNGFKATKNKVHFENTSPKKEKEMTEIITVEGMMCPHCEARVKKALEALPEVKEAVADHKTSKVTLTLTGSFDLERIKSAIEAQGYSIV